VKRFVELFIVSIKINIVIIRRWKLLVIGVPENSLWDRYPRTHVHHQYQCCQQDLELQSSSEMIQKQSKY
jgi:hypothetical protein